MTDLSNEIRTCRAGVIANPYQGTDRKVLFVCSMGILRSATGARLYAAKYNTRCCGTWDDALVPITPTLIAWADTIVFVNKSNYENVVAKWGELQHPDVRILDIPDTHPHCHPNLIVEFEQQFEPVSAHTRSVFMNKPNVAGF